MTREAKIGMLTGLGVIVLIGVLLSNYLGAGGGVAGGAVSPTGRMAELPMGAAYRQEITDPVGVPGMAHGDGAKAAAASPATMPAIAATNTSPDAAKVAMGPTVGSPVTPVPAGSVQMDQPLGDGAIPTLQLAEGNNAGPANGGTQAVYLPGDPKPAAPGSLMFTSVPPKVPAPVKGQEYVIAPGDTLGKIANRFYKSSQSEAVNRIVAANPKVLKDNKTMLIAGRKLIIPTVALVAKPPVAIAAVPPAGTKKPAALVIRQPGSATAATGTSTVTKVTAASVKDAPKKTASAVYVVQSGDTLEKIARKLTPTSVSDTVKKIELANGISDPTALKIGQKLKLPAAKAT